MKQRREPSKSKREAEPEVPEKEELEKLIDYLEDQAKALRQRLEHLKKSNNRINLSLSEN